MTESSAKAEKAQDKRGTSSYPYAQSAQNLILTCQKLRNVSHRPAMIQLYCPKKNYDKVVIMF